MAFTFMGRSFARYVKRSVTVYSLIYCNPCTMHTFLTSKHYCNDKFSNRTNIQIQLIVPYKTHYSSNNLKPINSSQQDALMHKSHSRI